MKKKSAKKNLTHLLVTLFVLIFVFLPIHSTNAVSIFSSIEEVSVELITNVLGWILYLMFSAVGQLISLMVTGLYYVINIPVYPSGGLAVIDSSWAILRNFANMFFIVALIVMAFATIFNITKYEARALFPKFLISAILINFSLVLGTLVIDLSQILSNTFLISIGDMSSRLGEGLINTLPLKQADISATAFSNTLNNAVWGSILTMIFSIFLLFTFAFSLLTAFLFAFIRIPILWVLLIVSPMAWMLNIFPAGQATYKKWWSTFIGWNMFLPIFLFFLYFGLYFLQNQDQLFSKIASETGGLLLGGSSFTLQILFFYILSGIFLIGGTIVAMKASMFSGTGVIGVAKWSRGIAARRLGLTAAGTAAQQKIGQLKQEGLPGKWGQKLYGGDYGLAQQTGRFGERFGVRGAGRANERAFVERSNKDYADFERQYQSGQISAEEIAKRAQLFSATDPRGLAYRKLAARIGQLDPAGEIFKTTLQQLSKNPLAAEDFAKSASAGKFSKMKGKDLAQMAAAEGQYSSLKTSVAARREMFRFVQTDPAAVSGLTENQFRAGVEVFGGHTTTEAKAFIKEVSKLAPDIVANYKLSVPDLKDETLEGFKKAYPLPAGAPPPSDSALKSHLFSGSLRNIDIRDTANINLRVWNGGGVNGTNEQKETSKAFKEALQRYLSQLSTQSRRGSLSPQTRYVQQLEQALANTIGGREKIRILYTDIINPIRAGRVAPTPASAPVGTPGPPLTP